MSQSYTVRCLSEAMSPITHAKGVAGNESLVMREPVTTTRGTQWVPTLSGNALRHRCVREPGWRWLIERWGLAGKLTLHQLNYAFHGGNLTEGGGRENTRRIADMQRLFPLSRLIGGCLSDQVIPGNLDVWRGRLVCEENRAGIAADMPGDWELPASAFRPAETFISGYQYTRGDAGKTAIDLLPKDVAEVPSNLMIFAGQSVNRGACFTHGFVLRHCGELELGAMLLSLRLWQANGGTIGGQAARGHGRLQTYVAVDGDEHTAVSAYVAHADAVADDAAEWLNDAFAARPEKPKKGKAVAAT